MKFAVVIAFLAAIVFDGLNFGQALEVAFAQPKVIELFTDLMKVIGPPATENLESQLKIFKNGNKNYSDMQTLNEAAKTTFSQFNHYFHNADYYKEEKYEKQREALQKVLGKYEKYFPAVVDEYPLKGSIAALRESMKKSNKDDA